MGVQVLLGIPGAARFRQEHPGAARKRQGMPGPARNRKELSGAGGGRARSGRALYTGNGALAAGAHSSFASELGIVPFAECTGEKS